MTEDTPAPVIPTEAPAAPSPTQALAGLPSDTTFNADFNGENGRPAQLAAMQRKSELAKAAHGPPDEVAPVVLPEQIADGLQGQTSTTRAAWRRPSKGSCTRAYSEG